MRVFISGPYSNGDQVINTRNAILAAEEVVKKGHVPFIPHLSLFWHAVSPHPVDFWYVQDLQWLKVCDVILRLPGLSKGADEEVSYAMSLGKLVIHDIDALR